VPLQNLPEAQAYATQLAAKHSDAYAAVITEAGSFQVTISPLPEMGGELDAQYTQRVEEHSRALLHLQGMKAAAVAILADIGMLRYAAEREVRVNVAVLAGAIVRDRKKTGM
jgi:hypothetical protein